MPIDKFGRHMLRAVSYSTIQKPTIDSTSFFLCKPTEFKSPCIINIKGVYDTSKSAAFYHLDNGDKDYICPISGIIDNIIITPNVKIFKNEMEMYDGSMLVDKEMRKGDKLRFYVSTLQKSLYVEITVLCPLMKNA